MQKENANLRTEVEKYLGDTTIYPLEYDEAKKYALHKLNLIIEREGDAGGERKKIYYLAQLIAETISANRFSVETMKHGNMLREIFEYADKMFAMGIKKEMPVS